LRVRLATWSSSNGSGSGTRSISSSRGVRWPWPDSPHGRAAAGPHAYEIFARYWPNQPAEDPLVGTLNELPKHVVSISLTELLAWQNSTLIKGDVAGQVGRLKDGPGKDIQVIGSGDLVQTLIQHKLGDEYRLMIHPLGLGTGNGSSGKAPR
jgi:dihydrofolate reductase